MKSRYKTFGEFHRDVREVHSTTGGFKLVCYLRGKEYVVMSLKSKPWNTPQTRKTFIARVYVDEMLWKCHLSRKIQRIEGFELLGRKVNYNDHLSVICNAVDMVNPDTGETRKQIVLVNSFRSIPFKVFLNQVQL